MKDDIPPLGPHSILLIRREGGVAHFPGLAAPRQIHCAEWTDEQRRRLTQLLMQAAQCQRGEASGADRRRFRLDIEDTGVSSADAAPCPVWSLELDEDAVPDALVTLWRQGCLKER